MNKVYPQLGDTVTIVGELVYSKTFPLDGCEDHGIITDFLDDMSLVRFKNKDSSGYKNQYYHNSNITMVGESITHISTYKIGDKVRSLVTPQNENIFYGEMSEETLIKYGFSPIGTILRNFEDRYVVQFHKADELNKETYTRVYEERNLILLNA